MKKEAVRHPYYFVRDHEKRRVMPTSLKTQGVIFGAGMT